MNFMGVGPAELIVILVVALVFVGPERLPRLVADIARTIREIRKYTGSIAAEFSEVIQEFESETAGERSQWKDIGEGLTGATRSVTEALRGARADAEAGPATPLTEKLQLSLSKGVRADAETAPAAAPARADASGAPDANGAQPSGEGAWREIAEPPAASEPAAPTTNGAAPSQPVEDAR